MSYNVGEVEVSVYPNAKEFNDRLAAQVNPQADKLGQQIGDTLAKQIAQGIRKGLGDFPSDNPAKDPAKRKGDEAAGAFGDAFKARLRAAMADLPDVKIGADSSAADRAIAAVRADMAALADKRIGVDLSDTEALAKLDELKAKLAEIGANSDSARVKVDTAAATAELVRFQAELDKIDGETATAKVRVDDGGGLLSGGGGISSLTGALAMVAPAIVPIGAAAAGGGMALAAMGAAGLGAAGVLVIAFKGVGDAVKLLGQQQTQQAAADASAGAGAAARAQAIVAAQRQMQSAQMALGDARRAAAQQEISDSQAIQTAQTGLADARRNAANQQLSDAQAVETAQHSLTQANDQVRLAQLALTAAQEAGRRELESYANNAADAALAQQQAALTLQETQVAAAKTMASSTATDLQKRQASLDVAKAQQSLAEANQRATESAKDNTKAQAAGVDGTQAVVSAQKQVTTAQDAQQKAAQGLSDAQRKAAQDQITSQESIAKAAQALSNAQQKAANDQITSHESIVRAQQGVAAAAEAMAAAQRQSAGTTNAALQATNDKIAKLDPATRSFAEYLRGTWAPIWDQVQHAAAGGLLPGVQAGMDALIPVMPGITKLVGTLASTMGDLFKQAGQALASPFWQHFITDIAQAGGPLLSDMARALGDIIKGFAGIVDAFLPLDKQIGDGLVGLTQKFADWGSNLASNPGFQHFVQYVQDSWPKIQQIIENVATAVGHIISASADLGGGFLDALKTLSGVLAALPVPVVEALVAAFIGLKVAQTIAGPIDGLAGSLKKIGGLDGAVGVLDKVSGSLPLIGVALGVAVPLIPAFLDFLKGTPGPAELAAGAIKDIGTELAGTNGVIDDTVRKTTAQKLQTMGLLDAAKEWGVSAKTMTDAALGNADAIAEVTAAAKRHNDTIAATGKTYGDYNGYVETATKKTNDQLTALNDLGGGVKDQVAKQGELSAAVYGSKAAADAMATASDSLKDIIKVAGDHMTGTWDNNTAILRGATDAQIADLRNLGDEVTTLPNGQVVVTSDTGPARAQMDQLIKDYANSQIAIAGGNFGPATARDPQGHNLFSYIAPGKAAGGPISGPGTGTSDTAGLYALSNNEHVWTAAEVGAAGGHAAVEGLRKQVLANGGGRAGGGPVFHDNMPAIVNPVALQAAEHLFTMLAPAAFAPGNATPPASHAANVAAVQRAAAPYGWASGPEWNALVSVINRESGFQNTAQNPTSTAFGMFQFLDSTWAGYGVGKTSDPDLQSLAGMRYIAGRYRDPLGALAHEQQVGWYDQGGVVSPGYHMLYNGTGANEVIAPQQTFREVVNQMHTDAGMGSGGPLQITGRLEIGGDGLARIIDGRIVRADQQSALASAAGSSTAIR